MNGTISTLGALTGPQSMTTNYLPKGSKVKEFKTLDIK